ncbi:hypothetical protein GAO09_19535 [Rhizobiales bacterium RZME27]|uniref:Uncharacterized protein n=1 Tax=Endobacterium cereale TaxID=2663029 RepID=A0A6A8AEN7_9HYPH|nr:hypothetical protein [Endobacterium cereale]MQY48230.1 hypothetical protein [Endobacterium cereale]
MSKKYRAEQTVAISGWECGTEIEINMVITFTVHPGSKATEIDPAEEPAVEVDKVRFFDGTDEIQLPWSIEDRMTSRSEFKNWLMGEAADQHEMAFADAADHKREMMREAYDG